MYLVCSEILSQLPVVYLKGDSLGGLPMPKHQLYIKFHAFIYFKDYSIEFRFKRPKTFNFGPRRVIPRTFF